MGDVATVAWREWREFREQLLSLKRGGLSALVLALILGVITPAQMGPEWLSSSLMLAYWPFVASSMVSSLIADAIAGERERHTLETLLATRLSDTAILVGKVTAAVLYGLGFAVANVCLGWLAVNVFHHEDRLLWFPAWYLASVVGLTFATGLFVAGVGVFISLRAATVKQAQQTFGIAMVVVLMAPVLIVQALPDDVRARLAMRFGAIGHTRLVLVIGGVLLLAGLTINAAALARFKRGRLVLD